MGQSATVSVLLSSSQSLLVNSELGTWNITTESHYLYTLQPLSLTLLTTTTPCEAKPVSKVMEKEVVVGESTALTQNCQTKLEIEE